MNDKRTHSKINLTYLIVFVILCLGCVSAVRSQNMMTSLNDEAVLSWYNQSFKNYEDSVIHYQEAIKLPQIPLERKHNLDVYQTKLKDYRKAMRTFVIKHRKEPAAAKALLISCFREIEINQDTLRDMARLLEGEGAENRYANYLRQELKGRAQNQVGKDFIDFSMAQESGKVIHTDQFRGKYLLINFWASWCGPCRAEMPSFLAVYHQFAHQTLEVVAVSVDTDRAAWIRAKNQDKTDWLNVFDQKAWNSPVVRNYAIHRIPQNILVDPEGKIIAKNISAEGLLKVLNKAGSQQLTSDAVPSK